jgi:diadenosine tetraphosphate (Ap4A) HIT family hydrolase
VSDDCLGCNLLSGATPLLGGVIYESAHWVVNHCVGPLGLGTLVVAPRRHVTRVPDLVSEEVAELGDVLVRTAQVIDRLARPQQVYVCLWHGEDGPKHLHWVVQPVGTELVERFGGKRSEALQLAMFEADEYPDPDEVRSFADQARSAFTDSFG